MTTAEAKHGLLDLPEPPTFQALWSLLAQERPDACYLKVPVPSAKNFLTYRVQSFYARALRVAHAFSSELRMEPGEGAAILSNWPHDVSLVLQGCWLGKFFAAPISLSAPDSLISSLLNQSPIKTVVFAVEDLHRVMDLMLLAPGVRNWIVCGTDPGKRMPERIRRFDEVISQAPRNAAEPPNPGSGDYNALLALTGGTSGRPRAVWLSERGIISQAAALARCWPEIDPERNIWSLLPHRSLPGLIGGYVAPLLTSAPCIIDPTFNFSDFDFWSQVRANDVGFILADQIDLRFIARRGKPRTLDLPHGLAFGLFTSTVFSMETLAAFEKRLSLPVFTHYAITEGGGVIASMPPLGANDSKKWFFDFDLPSSGVVLPGIEVKVLAKDGGEAEPEEYGEIMVRGPQVMKSYADGAGSPAEFDADGFLRTGDQGFFVDEGEDRHIFISGRSSELIHRGALNVNPFVIENLLFSLPGVEHCAVVGFPNVFTGFEVGAYVVLKSLSNLDEREILSALRSKMDWFHCPKVVVFGERNPVGGYPPRPRLIPRFKDFEREDFSLSRYKF